MSPGGHFSSADRFVISKRSSKQTSPQNSNGETVKKRSEKVLHTDQSPHQAYFQTISPNHKESYNVMAAHKPFMTAFKNRNEAKYESRFGRANKLPTVKDLQSIQMQISPLTSLRIADRSAQRTHKSSMSGFKNHSVDQRHNETLGPLSSVNTPQKIPLTRSKNQNQSQDFALPELRQSSKEPQQDLNMGRGYDFLSFKNKAPYAKEPLVSKRKSYYKNEREQKDMREQDRERQKL